MEKICDTTVFYYGDLEYLEYEKLNPEVKSLPSCLKIIFGKFLAQKTDIESVDLEFVNGHASFENNPNLTTVSVAVVMKLFVVRECESILNISVQHVKESVIISTNPKLITADLGEIGSELHVEINGELTSLRFGDVSGEAWVRNNSSLAEIKMGDVAKTLILTTNQLLKSENINSIYNGKISVHRLEVRDAGGVIVTSNKIIKDRFYIKGNV